MTLRFEISTDRSVPLDEIVIASVSLTADEPTDVSGQLNLWGGDLKILVTDPEGVVRRAGWPWPVDNLGQLIRLTAGETRRAAVPLLATSSSHPLFTAPGRYAVEGRFDAGEVEELAATPVTVDRTAPADESRADSLGRRAVIQSLLSASALDGAEGDLTGLAAGRPTRVRTLARLALGREPSSVGEGISVTELALVTGSVRT